MFRQNALAAIKKDLRLTAFGLTCALLMSGLITWLLTVRIIRPVAAASDAARSIAQGNLNVSIPDGGSDELGTLLTAMGTMRDNIRQMVEREVAQRRSAQARLADALESSQEGIVVLDAEGRVALANSRANELLKVSPELLHSRDQTPGRMAGIPQFRPRCRAIWRRRCRFAGRTLAPRRTQCDA